MKLKEFPGSIWRAFQLSRMSIGALHKTSPQDFPVIVSFTSIPSRFHVIHLTVRSILAGTHKPEKIVLWLNEQLKHQVPHSLQCLVGDKFEINYVEGNLPHRKLVHSLVSFPEKIIVTCDDDMMYAPSWLNNLYADHLRFPRDIIANECRAIAYDIQGQLLPYKEWRNETQKGVSYDSTLPIGYGGVLYPLHCFYADVCNAELYTALAPKADDLWFKAMSHLNGTLSRRASSPVQKPIPIFNSQSVSLKSTNVKQDGNRLQWEAIAGYYKLIPFQPLPSIR
jgi:hypothetical protein